VKIVSREPPYRPLPDVSVTMPPFMGFWTLRRVQTWEATYTEFASLGCAAPSGFLNLLAPYSSHALSGLVSCR
jgi:hypothetical protein